MNHLAHALLAGTHPDHRLGAFLGDHVKGRLALDSWPPEVAAGIVLHRRIDRWSDTHPAVRALRASAPPGWRRHCGIVFDVLFDAMLVRHWETFGVGRLDRFAQALDDLLAARRSELPLRLRRFAAWAQMKRLWVRLDDPRMLAEILSLLAARHARASPLASGLELMETMEAEIERAFLRLFPDLRDAAERFLDAHDPHPGVGRISAPG